MPTGGITVGNNLFSPGEKTVAPGSTVRWAWNSCSGGGAYENETCVAHDVTFADGQASPLQDKGTYSRAFPAAGVYDYRCTVHASMTGKITVQ